MPSDLAATDGIVPINMRVLDSSEQMISAAVEYAFSNGVSYAYQIEQWGDGLAGKAVLEVGPGTDFGLALYLACFGATVSVADRWLADWQEDYHGPVYSRLADKIAAAYPQADVTPLRTVVEAGGYVPEVIRLLPEMAEHLAGVADKSIDYLLSNAVFEHVPNLRGAVGRFAQVTKRGGLQVHQIDMRDHQNFDRPLEYLLLPADEEEEYLRVTDYHCGSPRRASEYEAAFKAAGLEILSIYVTSRADPGYLDDLLERLKQVETSRYRNWPPEDMELLGVHYVLRQG